MYLWVHGSRPAGVGWSRTNPQLKAQFLTKQQTLYQLTYFFS